MNNKMAELWISSEREPGSGTWFNGPKEIEYKMDKIPYTEIKLEYSSKVTTINIDVNKEFQTMLGIGTSMEETTVFNLARMSPEKRKEVITKLFDSVKGIGMNLIRVCIGTPDFTARKFYSYDDMPKGSTDPDLKHFSIQKDIDFHIIDTLKEIQDINPEVKFFASPWSPPGWMKEESKEFASTDDNNLNGGKLKDEYIPALAKYFIKFLEAYKEQGIEIYAITLQNEPLFEISYPSCGMTPDQQKKLSIALKKELVLKGLDVKIWIFDHNFEQGVEFAAGVLNSEEAFNAVDGIAFHDYDGEPIEMTRTHELFPSKDIMLTERAVWGTMGADRIAQYFRNWAISYNGWVTMLDSNIGPHQWTGTPGPAMILQSAEATGVIGSKKVYDNYWCLPEYYILGQFSKFIQRGAKRIESNYGSPETLTNVAFLNPDNTIVVVIINQTKNKQYFNIVCEGVQISGKVPAKAVATYRWYRI
ncbi:glycoside hydrolase family 30 protein [Clostridium thermarum]|uniref:glycoside hydrolase family 30 protein n=1 Tax=Clostridium thermarum TaxID=1716543 RepID=UPI001120F904|nr:glycoside hydrolase family 30 protein [Clostridium thermarum]